MLITLEELKKHLNLDASYGDDDAYITSLEEMAEELVQRHIDCTFDDIIGEQGEVPKPLLQAIKLLVGNFYDNRESVAYSTAIEIPSSLTYILSMYRNYTNANI